MTGGGARLSDFVEPRNGDAENSSKLSSRQRAMAKELGLEEEEIEIEDLTAEIDEIEEEEQDQAEEILNDDGEENAVENDSTKNEEKRVDMSAIVTDEIEAEEEIEEELVEFVVEEDSDDDIGIQRQPSGIFYNAELYASHPELRGAMLPPLGTTRPAFLPPIKKNTKL